MFPIYLNSKDRGYGFEEFREDFIKICRRHKEENRAMVFAFILYDFHNPQILKVLRDTEYWLSLNAISGKYITVFSLDHKTLGGRQNKDRKTVSYLTRISIHSDPSEQSNSLVESYFGKTQINYPAILFFQTDSEKVLDYQIVELNEVTVEKGFLELKRYIQEVVKTLELIKEDNRENYKEIFERVKFTLSGVDLKKKTIKGIKTLTSINKLASLIFADDE